MFKIAFIHACRMIQKQPAPHDPDPFPKPPCAVICAPDITKVA